jgi:hypothetical protein
MIKPILTNSGDLSILNKIFENHQKKVTMINVRHVYITVKFSIRHLPTVNMTIVMFQMQKLQYEV